MVGVTSASVLTYGSGGSADVRFAIASRDREGRATAMFTVDGRSATGQVPFVGDHMVANAAAATAVGLACGMDLEACVGALADARGVDGRGSWRSAGAIRILDDSYNANSGSMTAALAVLAGSGTGKLFAVLGAMAELDDPERAHRRIADGAAELGITLLALETDLYGSPPSTLDEVVAEVVSAGECSVLVKGSRAARTERVVEALLAR